VGKDGHRPTAGGGEVNDEETPSEQEPTQQEPTQQETTQQETTQQEPTQQEPTQQEPPFDPTVPPMPGQPAQIVYHVTQPVMTNGLATAALVCGIVGLVLFWTVWLGFILGVLAIVFGAVGRSRAAQGAPNRGQATAGLWLGIAAVVVSILFIGLVTTWISGNQGRIMHEIDRCMEDPELC
jgi:hypothetical protein